MLYEARVEMSIGPGLLEEIIVKGLKERGLAPENSNPYIKFFRRNRFEKQVEVSINHVKADFKVVEKFEPEIEEKEIDDTAN